jgi:putative nucleotidyltransferase with HDIG domain
MKMKDEIISKISAFPTLPVMVNRLLYVLNDQDAASSDVCKVIQYDPALTANVLKAANSSFLGFRQPVNSLAEATFRLGTKWIFQIAVSSLIYSNVKRPASGYELSGEELWRHSMAVALMSESLRSLLNIRDAGLVYTAALVHDIGKIALGEFISESWDKIEGLVQEKRIAFEKAEEEVLGIDHAELGAMIAENWHFPSSIVECIRWHHDPDGSANVTPFIDLVHIADSICLMEGFGLGKDDLQYRMSESSTTRLNITTSIMELAISQTIMSMEDIDNMFKEIPAAKSGQEVKR